MICTDCFQGVLFGGSDSNSDFFQDMWLYSNRQWTQVLISFVEPQDRPIARSRHSTTAVNATKGILTSSIRLYLNSELINSMFQL